MGRLYLPSLTVYVFYSYNENFIWTSSELQVDPKFYMKREGSNSLYNRREELIFIHTYKLHIIKISIYC